MAITIRDRAPRKRNVASLVGGYVIAVGCFVLWILCASQLTQWPPSFPVIATVSWWRRQSASGSG